TWPTPRPGWCATTCCTPASRSGHGSQWCQRRCSPARRAPPSARPSRNYKPKAAITSPPSAPTPTRHMAWRWGAPPASARPLADPATRLLLGAHIIGPQASTLIQPLIQAMCLGNTADQIASGVLYIHPALSEVVEQALLEL